MSATTILLGLGAGLLLLAWLFLVAVLRSHAEILRRLGAIESRLEPGGFTVDTGDRAGADPAGGDRSPVPAGTRLEAPDIVGETLAGDAVKLALGPGAPRTLLAFLSTGCMVCGPLWAELRAGGPPAPADLRIVVVTQGADRESPTRLERIAPDRGELVMSSAAWRDYAVTTTPHFVLVGEDARWIVGRGGATSWAQILSLLTDADSDEQRQRVRSTSERAERAEQALAASGIGPGHPSLYPSRAVGERRD